jgi:phospholipid transport system substrate-binding protein
VKKSAFFFVVLFFPLFLTSASGFEQPLDAVRKPVDEVLRVFKDPQYQDGGTKSLDLEKLRVTLGNLFDFNEISRRALARNWRNFDPQQREEFSALFGEFLGNTFLKTIQREPIDKTVVYEKQKMISHTKAVVKTSVLRGNVEIPVQYCLRIRNGKWRAYDVKIHGVSVVKNYRMQFEKLLTHQAPAELIESLKEKVEKQRQMAKAQDVPIEWGE